MPTLARRTAVLVRRYTRIIHVCAGLYFLLFTWLFSISGLVLNHSRWQFANFWPGRAEHVAELPIVVPAAGPDLATAQALMTQLHISGEVGQVQRHPDQSRLIVQVTRPGRNVQIDASLDSGRAIVKETTVNAWGVMSALHHFTGVRMDDPSRPRNWALTWLWTISMDALAAGLIVLVAGGVFLWYTRSARRAPGLFALVLGTAACAFFLFGLG